MYVFHLAADLHRHLSTLAGAGRSIGFVPTMGALHEGHISLVRCALNCGDLAVCSIFVNPTQFNDPEDLRKYPRTPEKDLAMLAKAGCQVLFMPPVAEVYPNGDQGGFAESFGRLEEVMEGAFRPGHFRGVAQVVARLLEMVNPHRLYMGQKDFQQTAIVAELLRRMQSNAQLEVTPTVREPDGLAMSSRNMRLDAEARRAAPAIYRALSEARNLFPEMDAPAICRKAMKTMEDVGLRPEYFEIVDGRTLQPIGNPHQPDMVVACTAAWAGDVRLIDNIVLKQ